MKRLFVLVVSIAPAAALLSVAHVARAQDMDVGGVEDLYVRHHAYESPQNFAVEVRLAPFFYPDVDQDPSLHGCTPFADIFGTGSTPLIGMEFDWQAIRIPHIGTLGPGFGIGYASFSANAPFSTNGRGTNNCITSNGQTSGENTAFNIFPMYLAAVFRADALWKDLGIPFVPYAKAGAAFALWQATNTLGTSNADGQSGQGYTLGSQLALGLSFNLNVLDPYTARNFDESMGVNSTYIFVEWTDADLNGLWIQSNPMRVGGTTWTFGIDWEF